MVELPLSVIWISGGSDAFLAEHYRALASAGLSIVSAQAKDSGSIAAEVRLLPPSAFADPEPYSLEYRIDPRPTLLLAQSSSEVERLLDLSRNPDEVRHEGETLAALAPRLHMLVARAESHRRLDEDRDRDALTGLWSRKRLDQEIRLIADTPAGADGVAALSPSTWTTSRA